MRVSDLLSTLREEFLDDNVEPYKWSDPYLLRLLTVAQEQAARRASLLYDTTHATAADVYTGASTATTAGALVDSAASFVSATAVGKTVYNLTDDTFTTISAFVSGTQLTLVDDIMASGDEYIIGDPDKALTRICLVSGTHTYPMSTKVFKIGPCSLASDGIPMLQKTEEWLDRNYYGWRTTVGTPRFYIEREGSIRVVPYPNDDINEGTGKDTMILGVYRYPLVDILTSTSSASPEIPAQYHLGLLDHVCEIAFGKQDADTYDAAKASRHAGLFIQKFGPPVSALVEQNIRKVPGLFILEPPKW